jgi:hypothetical protein
MFEPSAITIPNFSFAFKMAEFEITPLLLLLKDSSTMILKASAPLVICLVKSG